MWGMATFSQLTTCQVTKQKHDKCYMLEFEAKLDAFHVISYKIIS